MKPYIKNMLVVFMIALTFLLFSIISGGKSQVVFVKNGGSGDGMTYETAMGNFKEAVKKLSGTGGTIVVCGEYTFSELINLSPQSGTSNGKNTITVTSVYENVDYRAQNGAVFGIGNDRQSANIVLAGEFVFENITFVTNGSEAERAIVCGGNKVVFGEGITCKRKGNAPYLSVVGVSLTEEKNTNSDVTIKSGTYNYVCAGNRNAALNGNTSLTIDGGTFEGAVSATGLSGGEFSQNGTAKMIINGGTFLGSVGAIDSASGGFEMTLKNGQFKGELVTICKKNTINVFGGNFKGLENILIQSEKKQGKSTSSVEVHSFSGDIESFLQLLTLNDIVLTISDNIVVDNNDAGETNNNPSDTMPGGEESVQNDDNAAASLDDKKIPPSSNGQEVDENGTGTVVPIVLLSTVLSVAVLGLIYRITHRKYSE